MKVPVWRQVVGAFEKWLSLPNYDVVEVVAATVLANRLPGEPLWLALVGPSSSGKTEVVRSLETLRDVEQVDQMTTSTLASGYKPGKTSKRETNGTIGKFGLLSKHMDGRPFIITIGDFSSVLGRRHETRIEIMNQLRRVYDGVYDVPYGNGVVLNWRGKCGMIVCSTGAYDREMGSQSVFGDRFLVCRNTPGDPVQVAERAGRNARESHKMREELRESFRKIDKLKMPKEEIPLSLDVRSLVSRLCAFVAICRTQVPRDTYRHEITGVPEIEGTGRMSSQLHQLLRGLVIFKQIKEVTQDEISIIERVSFGTIPSLRMRVIEELDLENGTEFAELIGYTGIPKSVLHRTIEDMKLLDLIEWKADPLKPRHGKWFARPGWKPFFYHAQRSGGEV